MKKLLLMVGKSVGTIVSRLYDLVVKMAGVKGLVFVVGTYLKVGGTIDDMTWGVLVSFLVGARAYEKGVRAARGELTGGQGEAK